MESNSVSRTVFINPNFKNTHINPNFLISKPSSTIHVNPAFLEKFKTVTTNVENLSKNQESSVYPDLSSNETQMTSLVSKSTKTVSSKSAKIFTAVATNQPKLISKSRTKIIRESANIRPSLQKQSANCAKTSLIKIGTKKLIRTSSAPNVCKKSFNVVSKPTKEIFKEINYTPATKGKYKLDRRGLKSVGSIRTPLRNETFVTKYALSRVALKENLAPTKVLITKRKLLRIGSAYPSFSKKSLSGSVNKKLEMLNINGVLYKSTRNKLLKTTDIKVIKKTGIKNECSTGKRSIYIRGDKFVLDKSGRSLTRIENLTQDSNTKFRRIDIGGLTYVAKSQNVFIRTNVHKTRNHLSSAKQKSINVLSQKLVKSNIPCPIYRKVGKCAAFERGRCPKVHDKNHVSICSKFLRGECNNEKCLLSHEVSLSKMPTCKFFLQGCCIRNDCPYLHKKLNDKAEVCSDFLKGFCHLADKCKKRHEFVCPEFESTGKCEKIKCPYCRRNCKNKTTTAINVVNSKVESSKILKNKTMETVPRLEEKQEIRYFSGESEIIEIFETSSQNVSNPDNDLNNEISDENNVTLSSDNNENDENYRKNSLLSRRPKLGELPAFIPL